MIRYDWNVMRKLPINDLMVIIFALANHENLHDYPRKILEPISNFEDMSAYLLKPLPFILAKKKSYRNGNLLIFRTGCIS